ncbi:MAG TPA: copper homeostasis protein CutC [Terriglobales bacterium]|nr:copper homeostasis protein CutC [Terriglobales bacterium]
MASSTIIEICIDAVDSAIAAQNGGAQRVELCANLLEGGVTPSAGLITIVRKKISIGLQVIIRPRGGDFCYNDDEFQTMKQDIVTAKSCGADGIVVGLLNEDGSIDVPRTSELVELSNPLPVTFHRAFDVATDLPKALEDVISTGCKRILTSGGQPSALEGIESLAQLVCQSAGRIIILAAGSIKGNNAREIVEKTGVREVHAGLRTIISGRMKQSNKNISSGVTGMSESQRFVVLEEDVKKLKQALT